MVRFFPHAVSFLPPLWSGIFDETRELLDVKNFQPRLKKIKIKKVRPTNFFEKIYFCILKKKMKIWKFSISTKKFRPKIQNFDFHDFSIWFYKGFFLIWISKIEIFRFSQKKQNFKNFKFWFCNFCLCLIREKPHFRWNWR